MSLYLVILHFWIRVFGDSEMATHALSLLFAVITIPVFFALERKLMNRTSSFFGALLLSISPLFVYYAIETRSYSMLILSATVSSLLFIRMLRKPGYGLAIWLWIIGRAGHLYPLFCHPDSVGACFCADAPYADKKVSAVLVYCRSGGIAPRISPAAFPTAKQIDRSTGFLLRICICSGISFSASIRQGLCYPDSGSLSFFWFSKRLLEPEEHEGFFTGKTINGLGIRTGAAGVFVFGFGKTRFYQPVFCRRSFPELFCLSLSL